MSYRVLLTSTASVHLDNLSLWWAEHRSLSEALRWLSLIQKKIATLSEHPDRCPLANESLRFPFDLHELLFGAGPRVTHRILFRIVADTVEVLVIRHVARDKIDPNDMI